MGLVVYFHKGYPKAIKVIGNIHVNRFQCGCTFVSIAK